MLRLVFSFHHLSFFRDSPVNKKQSPKLFRYKSCSYAILVINQTASSSIKHSLPFSSCIMDHSFLARTEKNSREVARNNWKGIKKNISL
jgi:hypothetical protein